MKESVLKILVLCPLTVFLSGCMRDLDISEDNTPLGNFQVLWQTLDEKYCFFDEKKVDWDSVYQVYRPKVEAINNDDERALFSVFADMLNTLNDGHVNLYTPFDVSSCTSWYDAYPLIYNSSVLFSDKYLANYQTAGGMYYAMLKADSVGLMRLGSFSSSVSALNMYYVFTFFKDCKALILDVRHNGGGDLETAYRLASFFFDEKKTVGYQQHKNGKGHGDFSKYQPIEIEPSKLKWLRPIVVLTDRYSYSATNSFVNAMRYAPNCLVIGQKTGGGGGMPLSYELPNGWMLRFSSVRMTNADYQSIEDGVEPHLPVEKRSNTEDLCVEMALEIIRKAYENAGK